jgi:hypothetical protein
MHNRYQDIGDEISPHTICIMIERTVNEVTGIVLCHQMRERIRSHLERHPRMLRKGR